MQLTGYCFLPYSHKTQGRIGKVFVSKNGIPIVRTHDDDNNRFISLPDTTVSIAGKFENHWNTARAIEIISALNKLFEEK